MNNAQIVEEYNEFDDDKSLIKIVTHEKRLGELKTILEALNGLIKNEHYRNLNKLEWKPRFEKLQAQLRSERDPIQMYRIQGRLEELSDLIDFNLMKTLYDNEFNHIKGLIEQEKNAKEKNNDN